MFSTKEQGFQWYQALEINDLWFMNYESISWPYEPKILKTPVFPIFLELHFPKYVKFKIISTGDICPSLCLELNKWDWTVKEKNYVEFCGLF